MYQQQQPAPRKKTHNNTQAKTPSITYRYKRHYMKKKEKKRNEISPSISISRHQFHTWYSVALHKIFYFIYDSHSIRYIILPKEFSDGTWHTHTYYIYYAAWSKVFIAWMYDIELKYFPNFVWEILFGYFRSRLGYKMEIKRNKYDIGMV